MMRVRRARRTRRTRRAFFGVQDCLLQERVFIMKSWIFLSLKIHNLKGNERMKGWWWWWWWWWWWKDDEKMKFNLYHYSHTLPIHSFILDFTYIPLHTLFYIYTFAYLTYILSCLILYRFFHTRLINFTHPFFHPQFYPILHNMV